MRIRGARARAAIRTQLRHGWGSMLGLLLLALCLMPLPASEPGLPWAWQPPSLPLAAMKRGPEPSRSGAGGGVGGISRSGPAGGALGARWAAGMSSARPALAGPVEWVEVPPSPEGRQWWDAGSLRRDRRGQLSVLSRFQPAADGDPATGTPDRSAATVEPSTSRPGGAAPGSPGAATLYVMELDCGQSLYRDISVNGLPRWRAEWVPAGGDSLSMATLRAACAAAGETAAANEAPAVTDASSGA